MSPRPVGTVGYAYPWDLVGDLGFDERAAGTGLTGNDPGSRSTGSIEVIMEGKTETACRICEYDDGTVLYDEYGCALFVICPCCYSEAGVEDCRLSGVRESRRLWLASGGKWHSPECRPTGWDLEKQLANIPAAWR